MKDKKMKIFRTIKAFDAHLLANNYRACGYASWKVADQVVGGRSLYHARESGEIKQVEVINEKGRKEWVYKSSDIKRITLKGIKL